MRMELKFIETESTIEIARGWWWMKGEWELVSVGMKFQFEKMKNSGDRSGDSWTTWMVLVHFKSGLGTGKFYVIGIYHNNEKFE